jgi:hypothetical protein
VIICELIVHLSVTVQDNKTCPVHVLTRGPGSSVGIVTDYGIDGPEIESRWGRDFSHTSRPALGAHPASFTPGKDPGVKWPGRGAGHPPSFSVEVENE